MALRVDASGEYFHRTTNLPTLTSFTAFFRFCRRGAGGASNNVLWALQAGADTGYMQIDGSNIFLWYMDNGGFCNITSPTIGTDTWYDCAIRQNGSGAGTVKLYLRATGDMSGWATNTCTGGTQTLTGVRFNYVFSSATYWFNGAYADFKLWDAVLTDDELTVERWIQRPARTTNLRYWLPIIDSTTTNITKDYSGNGYDFTQVGTLSVEDGPPVSWGGSIITPHYATSTAPTLSLPGVQDITATTARPKVTLTFA